MSHHHPPSRLSRLPLFISHFLGYRTHPLPPRPPHIIYLWSFIGSFIGLAVIQAVFGQAHYFIERGVPGVIASYGATAVLIYGSIDAPLAQPLPTFGGHLLGALIGVCITKLFALIKDEAKFESVLWLSGTLACSTTIVVMQMTGTTHPPAGATALLASTNTDIRLMGWYYIPVVMLTSVLVLMVALVNNNIQRRYPVFWWKAAGVVIVPGKGVRGVNGVRGNEKGLKCKGEEGEEEADVDGSVKDKTRAQRDAGVDEKGDVIEVKENEVDTETDQSRSRSRSCSHRHESVV